MQVVRRVDREAISVLGLEIGVPGIGVGAHCVTPASDTIERVRRHVLDVASARDRAAQVVGAGLGPTGLDRGLSRVDVQVTGTRVRDVLGQYRLEHTVQSLYRRLGHVPGSAARLEQHERFTREKSNVEVVGVGLVQFVDTVGPHLVELAPLVAVVLGHVAHRHRLDQRSLDLGGVAVHDLERLLDRGVRSRCVRRNHGAVEVRTPRPRLTEVAHRAVGVELPRRTERARREVGLEGVQELYTLIEIEL